MEQYLKTNIPQLKLMKTEGLYLTWVDCRALGLDSSQLEDFMLNKVYSPFC